MTMSCNAFRTLAVLDKSIHNVSPHMFRAYMDGQKKKRI